MATDIQNSAHLQIDFLSTRTFMRNEKKKIRIEMRGCQRRGEENRKTDSAIDKDKD